MGNFNFSFPKWLAHMIKDAWDLANWQKLSSVSIPVRMRLCIFNETFFIGQAISFESSENPQESAERYKGDTERNHREKKPIYIKQLEIENKTLKGKKIEFKFFFNALFLQRWKTIIKLAGQDQEDSVFRRAARYLRFKQTAVKMFEG